MNKTPEIVVAESNDGWRILDPVAKLRRGPYATHEEANAHAAALAAFYRDDETLLPCGCAWHGDGPLRCPDPALHAPKPAMPTPPYADAWRCQTIADGTGRPVWCVFDGRRWWPSATNPGQHWPRYDPRELVAESICGTIITRPQARDK